MMGVTLGPATAEMITDCIDGRAGSQTGPNR